MVSPSFLIAFPGIHRGLLCIWYQRHKSVLVGGAITILKNMKVNGKDSPYIIENKKMFETTNQVSRSGILYRPVILSWFGRYQSKLDTPQNVICEPGVLMQGYLFRKLVLAWKLCKMEKTLPKRVVSCEPLTINCAFYVFLMFPLFLLLRPKFGLLCMFCLIISFLYIYIYVP